MNYYYQTGSRDCFPACFRNALLHCGVAITPVVIKRLAVFKNGIEHCPVHASQERLEIYPRSLNKFIAEWHWALGHKDDTGCSFTEPLAWARYLLEMGIHLEARNGPIENKRVILDALTKKKIVICDIWIPSPDFPDSSCKHYVLLVGSAGGKLLVHDPLPALLRHYIASDRIAYIKGSCGSNCEIDCDYFFSEEMGYMKPRPNPQRSDNDYSFLILSRNR